ncbi:MAG TPA: proline dehydrogenase family protein [Gaiellales bacterium]|nr:proline dehydrogenase family protein [Gaiellales bacterium]
MRIVDRAVVAALPAVPKPLVRRFAARYMAGETLEQAVEVVRELNRQGVSATIDVLGEFIRRVAEAEHTATVYSGVLAAIERERLDANISLKLSALGLEVDAAAAGRLLRGLLADAGGRGTFVRVDMEHSALTDQTLNLYLMLRSEGFENLGIVLQAYLLRTVDDVEALASLRPRVRLVKGIYVEPASVAHRDMRAVNRNYVHLLERLVELGCHVAVATHDRALIEHALQLIDHHDLAADRYEFQMLLGVAEDVRARLVAGGHPTRVYVPFGEAWYGYSVRRLKENPSLAGYVARDALRSLLPAG